MDDIKRMGKYVSMLLRHHPEEAGVILDEHGWTDVEDLIQRLLALKKKLIKYGIDESIKNKSGWRV